MKGLARWLLLAASTLWVGQALATEPPEVLWYLARFPPSSIQDGPERGRGYLDRMLAEIIQPALPQLRHRVVSAAPARLAADIARLPNVCAPALTRTSQRLSTMQFSQPLFRFLPVGLVVRKEDLALLNRWRTAGGAIDLGRMLDEGGWVLGVVNDRRHGSAIDHVLEQHPASVTSVRTLEANVTLLRMVALQRGLRATLAYSFDVGYLESRYAELRGHLAWLPVAGMSPALMAHVACSRSPLGSDVVRALDRQMSNAQPQAQALYEAWLDAESRQVLAQQRRELRRGESFWQDNSP